MFIRVQALGIELGALGARCLDAQQSALKRTERGNRTGPAVL